MVGRPCCFSFGLLFQRGCCRSVSHALLLLFCKPLFFNLSDGLFISLSRVSPNFGRFRVFFGLVAIALSCLACVLDWDVYLYFTYNFHDCYDNDGEGMCYCETNKKTFERYFGRFGYVKCDNVAAHNSALLLTNFIFSLLSSLVAAGYWVYYCCCRKTAEKILFTLPAK